ncbi:amidase domain-containing protein [Paenibacillus tarimensis]|uniref:amidase domain-containing protein n=1 Tax=Paenibacillus tarimensis TaxID=416012 RepID=UPI001F2128FD|nr:amidase domain-containing protein [Paenibacillus tarimensis]MCF2945996.1 amidase domain-containing protein [Paenibacillus tarimensis]
MPAKQVKAPENDRLKGWKAAVYEYVKLVNQAGIEPLRSDAEQLIADLACLQRIELMRTRVRQREQQRGADAMRQETRVRLLGIQEQPQGLSVDLERWIKRLIRQGSAVYTEERVEQERLLLEGSQDSWQITRVEPSQGERIAKEAGVQADRGPGTSRSTAAAVHGHSQESPNGQRTGQHITGAPERHWHSGTRWETGDMPAKPLALPYINYELLHDFNNRDPEIPYRRDLAAAYADRWWNESNPAYELFDVNCTNYVSQCVFAGHAPMNYTGRRESGWWYKGRMDGREWWSYSWSVSNALAGYLSGDRLQGLRAEVVRSPEQLQLGDVIAYDWDGSGRYGHSTIVTAFDRQGMPLVNANTVSSRHRYWDYKDSHAWSEATRYRFFHIADYF